MLLVACGLFSMFFFATLYVQEVLGYSPLKAGLAFLPVTAGHRSSAPGVAQALISGFGRARGRVVGMMLAAAGLLWLTGLPVDGTYVATCSPACSRCRSAWA